MSQAQHLTVIKDYLTAHNETLAVAESVTSGYIQAAFSSAENARKFFQGGITTYNLGQKCRHLNVDPIQAGSCNCVSEIVAIKMSENVCALFAGNWGLGITGYAAPVPELNIKDLFAYYAISYEGKMIKNGKINAPMLEQVEAQKFYVEKILQIFAAQLQKQ